jgi:hypothetical protein
VADHVGGTSSSMLLYATATAGLVLVIAALRPKRRIAATV